MCFLSLFTFAQREWSVKFNELAHRYDRSLLTFRKLEDIQFVAAMGPPGGGRNNITQRYSRHYNVVSMTAFDVNNMTIIFQALVDWWLGKHNYSASITKVSKPLVAATIDTYLRCGQFNIYGAQLHLYLLSHEHTRIRSNLGLHWN